MERYTGKWLALYFYQRDFSEPSWVELNILNTKINEIRELGGEVVGVSPDSLQTHTKFAVERKIMIELVSDQSGELASLYGALKQTDPIIFRKRIALIAPDGTLFKIYVGRRSAMHVFELLSNMRMIYRLAKADPINNVKMIYHF